MFTPSDFALLARELAFAGPPQSPNGGASHDARLRTAFGRAYYALYLMVRLTITRRYGIPERKLTHGLLYTHLQHSRAGFEIQKLGRELQRLYRLRQQADYVLALESRWAITLADPRLAMLAAEGVLEYAEVVDQLDFHPVLHLFR